LGLDLHNLGGVEFDLPHSPGEQIG